MVLSNPCLRSMLAAIDSLAYANIGDFVLLCFLSTFIAFTSGLSKALMHTGGVFRQNRVQTRAIQCARGVPTQQSGLNTKHAHQVRVPSLCAKCRRQLMQCIVWLAKVRYANFINTFSQQHHRARSLHLVSRMRTWWSRASYCRVVPALRFLPDWLR